MKGVDLNKVLRDTFGKRSFRPAQKEIITHVLKGDDVFARLPTGGGKSLCFQLPAAVSDGTTIVISPLIALMRDQIRALREFGISATDLNSNHEPEERAQILRDVRDGVFKLLYVAPEQLAIEDFRNETRAAPFNRIVVDEAHCISQWGHDFRPSYRRISDYAAEHDIGQVVAFTATASHKVAADVEKRLDMEEPFEYMGDVIRPNLQYSVTKCQSKKEKARALLELLRDEDHRREAALIYCATRPLVMEVFDFLRRMRMPVTHYHAGLPGDKRKQAETDFYNNKKRIMVATNAFGMGVDKPDIRLLVHFNMPGNIENYLQETGRAGRDGQNTACALLYSRDDIATQELLQRDSNPDINFVEAVHRILRGQERKYPIEGEANWFTLRKMALEHALRQTYAQTRSIEGAAISAMSVLEEFGILEVRGRRARLGRFDGADEIAKFIAEKRDAARRKLDHMAFYANDPDPSQKLLVKLMESA